jgi:hypothetical protein
MDMTVNAIISDSGTQTSSNACQGCPKNAFSKIKFISKS